MSCRVSLGLLFPVRRVQECSNASSAFVSLSKSRSYIDQVLHSYVEGINLKNQRPKGALTGVAQWVRCRPENQRVAGLFLARAHAWVAGQLPGGGMREATHGRFSPSLFPSLPLSLKINK